MKRRVNPRRRPATMADVNRAKQERGLIPMHT